MYFLENIDIDKEILKNIDIDIDIDKGILQNIDIDEISYRFKFAISNSTIWICFLTFQTIKCGRKENSIFLHRCMHGVAVPNY